MEKVLDGRRRKDERDNAESERRLSGTPEIESWRRLTSTCFENHPWLIICMYLPKRWALIAAILTRYPQVAVSPASNRAVNALSSLETRTLLEYVQGCLGNVKRCCRLGHDF
jgi:hypothetical protein